jgi:hypothetical protein
MEGGLPRGFRGALWTAGTYQPRCSRTRTRWKANSLATARFCAVWHSVLERQLHAMNADVGRKDCSYIGYSSESSRAAGLLAQIGASNGQGHAFPRRALDPFGHIPSGVPNVSRRFISCSRQSTDRTQHTPHNLLDEFRCPRAFRRGRCRVDLLAIAYLSDLRDVGCEPDSETKRLADGTRRAYWYAWKGGPPLRGKPGTPEFVHSYNEAAARKVTAPEGKLLSVLQAYQASGEFNGLAARYAGSISRIA